MTAATGIDLLIPDVYDLAWSIFVLAWFLVLAGAAGAVVLLLARRAGPVADASAAVVAARRHERRIGLAAWAALVLALVGAVVADRLLGPEVPILLAPAGLLFLAVHAAGEMSWPRPTGEVRRAALARRRVADVAHPVLRTAAWGWAAAAVLALAGGFIAEPGELGPGALLVVGLAPVAVAVAAEGTLRLVVRRPTVSDADPAWDLGLRRRSALRVLRGAQLCTALAATDALATTWAAGSAPIAVVAVAIPLLVLGLLVVPRQSATPTSTGSGTSSTPNRSRTPSRT